MQKMFVVFEDWLDPINKFLDKGWKVCSVTPFTSYGTPDYGAYIVIEKDYDQVQADLIAAHNPPKSTKKKK